MDKEPKKEYKLPSILEMSEMFDKVQSQINPLSYHLEKSNSLMEIASQYDYLNSAVNIADIASKAVQPVNFASSGVVDHSTVTMNEQLKVPEAMAVQDNFLEMTKGVSAFNNSIMSVRESLVRNTGGINVYENMMSSVNLIRDSLEPYRSAFDAVRNSFEASESFKLASELQSQDFLPNSLSVEYSTVFEQLESLRNLESFKAISRLKNFPNDKIWTQDYDKGYEVTEDFLTEVKTIDAKISDEISSVDDFNDLSEETQNSLKQVFSEHYEYFIMKIIVSLSLLQENLNKDLDLSNKSFIFVNSLEVSIFFIGSYWNQNKSAIINGLITTAIYNAFIWLFFMK
ncbi:hypothetical protein ACTXIP_06825 [Psychrobacter alimentarius]|uniref:hypothetical protein n=1 Tax=Psychrobacter alimentarius TaxID=261164 RepID=UPI003FCFC455